MTHLRFLKAVVLSFVLFVVLDGLWHSGLMADFYNQRLVLLNPSLDGAPAVSPFILVAEALNAVALSYFVLNHEPKKNKVAEAAWIGGLLGITVCGSINFLNHSLIPQWDLQLALLDTAWGTVLGVIVGAAVGAFCAPKKAGFFSFLKRS